MSAVVDPNAAGVLAALAVGDQAASDGSRQKSASGGDEAKPLILLVARWNSSAGRVIEFFQA